MKILLSKQDWDKLAKRFLKAISGEIEPYYWIGDEVGGVLEWGIHGGSFASGEDIIEYFRLKLTPKEFFDWQEDCYEKTKEDIDALTLTMEQFKKQLL